MFFDYVQNNSYGKFDYDEDDGIGPYVIIEADDADMADWRAKRIGLYFGGVGDCPCCGDRWYEQNSWGSNPPGDDVPKIYNEPLTTSYVQAPKDPSVRGIRAEHKYEVFVHYMKVGDKPEYFEGWSAKPS